jgi:DNA-binding transcriptional LysR family regulator
MLRTEWLEAFIAFAERLNFTHAARALHLSQPALFVQIGKLAETVGVPLYTKTGRQLLLTPAGQRLLAFAREQRERDGEVLSELRTGRAHPTVTLAAGTGSFLYLLGAALREFLRVSPARLRLLQRERGGTVDAVKSGEAQLGVAAFDAIPDDLDAQLLTRVPQLVVMPRQHELAARRRLKLRDLEGVSLIVPPVGQPQRATLEQALSSAGVRWQPAVEATGWTLVLRFVELGLGLTVVNGCCEIPRGLVARPLHELPSVSYYVISRAGGAPGAETRRLRGLILAGSH